MTPATRPKPLTRYGQTVEDFAGQGHEGLCVVIAGGRQH